MSWIYLYLSIILEIAGTTCIKLSEGYTKIVPSLIMVVCYSLSIISLGLALKKIEIGVAYAIWSGMGTFVIAAIGIVWFKESATLLKITSLILIVVGVISLNLSGSSH